MDDILVRKFTPEDRGAVRRISCETSFLEADRSVFIDDDEILADVLTAYYTDYEPGSSFVAVSGDKVVGYIICSTDTVKIHRVFNTKIAPAVFMKALRRGVFFRKKILIFIAHILKSIIKGEFKTPDFSKDYPATLHINIDAGYRGQDVGTRLIQTGVDFLKKRGVKGVSFGTMSDGARRFFEKTGFKVLYESKRSYMRYRINKDVSFYVLGRRWP